MLAGWLEQVGIFAQVQGDQLQGGVGELPAGNMATLWVAEDDEAQALDVIAEYEASQPSDNEVMPLSTPLPDSRHGVFMSGFLIGVIVGAMGVLALINGVP